MELRMAAVAASIVALAGMAHAQSAARMSDSDYMKKALTAAPPQIAQEATIVRVDKSGMQTLKKGTNEFTCMIAFEGVPGEAPMCMDPSAMEWAHAWGTHAAPPNKTGFMYMLAGDTGASNTDPYATAPKPDNHWIQTGSHVMIVGGAAKEMAGYPRSPDPDPTKPYVMWPGTPYEHLMIPVK